jgi:hypothetical protein
MKQSDFDRFHAMLSGVMAMWDKVPTAQTIAVWFRALEGYDIATLSAAFSAHMRDPQNGKFEPKPAHIIEQIERAAKNDGRPGPEEAWAISVVARSEDETVVWTAECAQAWAAAKPIMDMGDEVGARMAFREAYARLVAEARSRGEATTWDVSEGFDKERRRLAVSSAIEAGRIPAGSHLALEQGSALLLQSAAKRSGMPPEVRERMAELRAMFTKNHDGPSEADAERDRLTALKREQQAKVDQFQQGRST